MDSLHDGRRGRATTQMRVIMLFSSKEMRNLNGKEKRIKRGAWIVPGNTDASISVACCSGSPNHQMYDQTTTAPKWRKTNRRNNLLSWNRLPGVGGQKNEKNKQTKKIAHTWSASLQATATVLTTTKRCTRLQVSPKKKLFNRRRKKLLELQCFLSVDWYKQPTMRVLLSEHRHHIQVPPRRSAYLRDVCSRETIRYAHKRAHKEVTQNDEAADGGAHRRERHSYAYMIVNTVSLFWRK